MAITYEPIATTTLGSAAASVTFSSISGSYTDLVIIVNATGSGAALNPQIQFNGDTASNYSLTWLYGNGSTAVSGRYSNQTSAFFGYMTTTEPATYILQVQNYSNTTTNKSTLFRWNATNTELGAGVALYRSTAAITSITLKTSANNFASGSTFTLYGIASA